MGVILKGTARVIRGRGIKTGNIIPGRGLVRVFFFYYYLSRKISLVKRLLPQRTFEERWENVVRKMRVDGAVLVYLV